MIIVKLIGGLGNQMFQYAAGKALSLERGTELLIDKSDLDKETNGAFTKRHYELGCFNITERFANSNDLFPYKNIGSSRLKRLRDRYFPWLVNKVSFYESGNSFHRNFFKLPANTYLNGFWQSEKYFKKYETQIRNSFQIKDPLPDELKDVLQNIRTTTSVSLHVRRGDYVSLKSANDYHGLCSQEYYEAAIDKLKKKYRDIVIFVFSDDIEWCKTNLNFNSPMHFISQNKGAQWDLYLMSECRHNIIANSSFSWWGSWLNTNPNKVVIAPKNWFRDTTISTNDLIPENWIRL